MKKIGVFCLFLLVLASCRRDSITTTTAVQNPLISSANTMLVSSMTTSNSVSRFQYDSSNRLVAETDSGSYDMGPETVASSFTYDTDGNLITREIKGLDGDTVYNINYANGQPTTATYTATFPGTGSKTLTGIITYTVTNNKVTELDGSVYPGNQTLKLTYSGDNIASITVANGSFADPVVNYTYGTSRSPFAASAFKWYLFPDCLPVNEWQGLFESEFPVNLFNQNDLESLAAPGGHVTNLTFTNQYNALGYPTQIVGNSVTVTYQYVK